MFFSHQSLLDKTGCTAYACMLNDYVVLNEYVIMTNIVRKTDISKYIDKFIIKSIPITRFITVSIIANCKTGQYVD